MRGNSCMSGLSRWLRVGLEEYALGRSVSKSSCDSATGSRRLFTAISVSTRCTIISRCFRAIIAQCASLSAIGRSVVLHGSGEQSRALRSLIFEDLSWRWLLAVNGRNLVGSEILVECGLQTECQSRQVGCTQIELGTKLSPSQLLVANFVIATSFYNNVEELEEVYMPAADSWCWIKCGASLLVVGAQLFDEFMVFVVVGYGRRFQVGSLRRSHCDFNCHELAMCWRINYRVEVEVDLRCKCATAVSEFESRSSFSLEALANSQQGSALSPEI